ncbi:hypothetical protein GCM10007392_48020 [Saccharospirillum salsuginis]|uniref:Uncharacterized protein n=1 Tax=Saccharospirillum salsuginis TaxID=418750 RepID=A0A918KT56_9GAMM|nr:hypothetical protein GCM10007392_48020 [Saccharospirillum salsuginis]
MSNTPARPVGSGLPDYTGNLMSHALFSGEDLYEEQLEALAECVATWRERLMSFMTTRNYFL